MYRSMLMSLRSWIAATRPKTLVAGACPVVLGCAAAYHSGSVLHWPTVIALLTCTVLLQTASNYANDVFDYEHGADTDARVGPKRAVSSGEISPLAMRRAVVAVLFTAFIVGMYLVARAGWPIFAIGVCSIAGAVAYTGGPVPLAYIGLGEVMVVLYFGLAAVCGSAFALAGFVPAIAWPLALVCGVLSSAILVVNNTRDIVEDRQAHKMTLVARFGLQFARIEFCGLLLCGVGIVAALGVWTNSAWLLGASLVLSLLGWQLLRDYDAASDTTYNIVLGKTARLLVIATIALTIGISATQHGAGSG